MATDKKTYSYGEALRLSRKTGQQFLSASGFTVKYYSHVGWTYQLTFTELMARYRPVADDEIDAKLKAIDDKRGS